MPCFKPISGFAPLEGGAILFHEKKDCREVQIPCGQCIGCRLEKRDAWAFRCMAEASLHKNNWFATLTYDDDKLPENESLNHRDWQLFAHRLRKRAGSFRFFMCGEYGDETKRAHFHALLFGLDLPDFSRISGMYSEHDNYKSKLLEECWGNGFTLLGNVCYESAQYVAGYVCKRMSKELASERMQWVTRYGEVVERAQPYGKMSLKPGIGAGWLEKYWKDTVNHGAVYQNQYRKKIPPYFNTLIERIDPVAAEDLEARTIERGLKFFDPENSTRDRLAVREACANARVKFTKEKRNHAV